MAFPPRRFNPAPGIVVDLAGTALEITGRAEIWGAEANASRAAQIQNTINSCWTMNSGGASFTCNILVTYRGANPAANILQIELLNMLAPSNVATNASRRMQLNMSIPGALTWTAAHEFGHVMGLADRYSETAESRASGDRGGPRSTPPQPGYAGNMMAVDSGKVALQNALDLALETQPSEWGMDDDDEVRAWVNAHSLVQLQALAPEVRLRGMQILMSGWVSDGDILAMRGLLRGVTQAAEARALRTSINPLDLTDIGQRTSLRLAMEQMPR